MGNAYTKLSCNVPISGWSGNLLTSFKGARTDLLSFNQTLTQCDEAIQQRVEDIYNNVPVYIPLSSLQFLWEHNAIALICSEYNMSN